jgi:hypothetical protein
MWTPQTHGDVPQPAGKLAADWYEATQPTPCDLLYALAHTKAQVDSLVAALREVCDELSDLTHASAPYQGPVFRAVAKARAALAQAQE